MQSDYNLIVMVARRTPFFHLLFFFLFLLLLLHDSTQFQPSQYEALSRIKQLLNIPEEISSWSDNTEFCNTEPNQILTVSCYEDSITQLHVNGNKWFPHLLQNFSTVSVSLFSNLANFQDLKVLSLVSLGLKGPLPAGIGKLSSLEILNVSCNYFDGIIPLEISSLKNLQTLILDYNRFTGEVPDWIASFPGLSVLSLKNNSFTGQLPNSLNSLKNLRSLVISANNLTGQLPPLQNLTNLQVLHLQDNNLGPQFPSLPTKLISLILSNNKFHSAISDSLSSCYQLKKLDISSNEIVGPFPLFLFSLPSLNYLNIAGNKLTGKLSQNISCNADMVFVDLSENRLTGELPDCLLQNPKNRVVLFGGNCLSGRYQNQHPETYCHSEALAVRISPQKPHEKRPYGKVVLASSMVGGSVGAIALVGLAFLVFKRKSDKKQQKNEIPRTRLIVDKVSPAYTLQLLKDARYISETMKWGALGIPPYRTFVWDELNEATINFNESNLIGEGTHGQLYKGWLTDGTIVAIRSLKMRKRHSIQSYTHQIELISKLRHSHLVSSIGHCFECRKDDSTVSRIFLVFEYVPNGTLRKFTSEGNCGQKFTWTQRITAATEVARGIQFLHTGMVPGVYSNHLKIKDVLLDHDLHAKISNYNIPLLMSLHGSKEKHVLMSEKNDVYNFGVILLEMIVGRMIVSENDVCISKDILLVSLSADEKGRRSVVDPVVHKECSDDSLRTLIELCVRCLSNEASERPSVEDVIWNLQFAAQVQNSSHNTESPIQGI